MTDALPPKVFGLNRESALEILRSVSEVMKKFDEDFMKPYNLRFGKKNLSEIIGKVFEVKAAAILSKRLGSEVINAESDSDPDLYFRKGNYSLELKVTSTGHTWRGGEFSKRPSQYLLLSWNADSNYSEYFLAYTHLTEDDWKSSMQAGQRYYAPKFNAKNLLEKEDHIVFVGSLEKTLRGAVRVKYEAVEST